MTIVSATDHQISIDGTDITDWVVEVNFEDTFETKDKTTFGSNGKRAKTGGLEDGQVTLSCLNDYASSALDGILWGLRNQVVDVVATPTSAAVSATNPQYTNAVHVNKLTPIAAKVGDLPVQNLTFPGSGGLTRATSS